MAGFPVGDKGAPSGQACVRLVLRAEELGRKVQLARGSPAFATRSRDPTWLRAGTRAELSRMGWRMMGPSKVALNCPDLQGCGRVSGADLAVLVAGDELGPFLACEVAAGDRARVILQGGQGDGPEGSLAVGVDGE